MKRSPQFVGLLCMVALLAPVVMAQEKQEKPMTRESGAWSQAMSGTLAAAKNVRIKLDMGSVVVRGGKQQGIHYVVHSLCYTSEQEARRQFESFKINSSVKGDTAWIVAEWQGGRPRKFSGELVVEIPRETDMLKVETGGGGVEATGVSGSVYVSSGGGKIRVVFGDQVAGHVDDLRLAGGRGDFQALGYAVAIGVGAGAGEFQVAENHVVFHVED